MKDRQIALALGSRFRRARPTRWTGACNEHRSGTDTGLHQARRGDNGGATLAFALGATVAVSAPIYKCTAANSSPIYTDQPCKSGEILDIHPGEADRNAVERLQVARDMLDRGAAARIAAEQREADQRAFAAMAQRQGEEDRTAMEADASISPYDSYAGWWYPGTGQMHRPRPPHERPPRPTPHGAAPKPALRGPPFLALCGQRRAYRPMPLAHAPSAF